MSAERVDTLPQQVAYECTYTLNLDSLCSVRFESVRDCELSFVPVVSSSQWFSKISAVEEEKVCL